MWYKFLSRFPIKYLYPLLLAAFPVLALFVNNYGEVGWGVLPRPLLVSMGLAAVVLLTFRLLLKNWAKAALMTAWFIILFFLYGHVRNLLLDRVEVLGRHRYLGVIFAGLCGLGWMTIWRIKSISILNTFLSMIAIMGIGILLIQTMWKERSVSNTFANVLPSEHQPVITIPKNPPDVYYIILDMYGRSDVLLEQFQIDNSGFLKSLSNLGFYIADCSMANYPHTALSLGSSMNYSYWDEKVSENINANSENTWDPGGNNVYFGDLIQHSAIRNDLESIGYKTVAFETSWDWLNLLDADTYFSPGYTASLSQFELLVIKSSMGQIIWDGIQNFAPSYYYKSRRDQQLFILDRISDAAAINGPKFVFIHIAVPHTPFVFAVDGSDPTENPKYYDNSGSPSDPEYYRIGYKNQVEYINQRVGGMIDDILQQSTNPPIIILQGDHGPTGEPAERLPILNAYFFPGKANVLYPAISPVNTFRLVLNEYFGADMDILPDHSYYLDSLASPLVFREYLDEWEECRK